VPARAREAGAYWLADQTVTRFGRVGGWFQFQYVNRYRVNGSVQSEGRMPFLTNSDCRQTDARMCRIATTATTRLLRPAMICGLRQPEAPVDLSFFRTEYLEPGIAYVTFDRPPVNAQNRQSRYELTSLMDYLSERTDVAVVVLTGAGRIFSAGADIKERVDLKTEGGEYRLHNRVTRDFLYSVTDCSKPVIAAINGPAVGAGYAIAAGCDILVASSDAYIQMPEIDRGLMGGSKFLEQHLPRSVARLLFFTGRKLGADELLRYGVVVDVVAPELLRAAAISIAADIGSKFSPAIQKAKATFNAAEAMPYRDGYRFEQTVTHDLAGSRYVLESQRAFLEKRSIQLETDNPLPAE
jgi:enoyl-CoA hydratase